MENIKDPYAQNNLESGQGSAFEQFPGVSRQEKSLNFISDLARKYERMELTNTQELAVIGYIFIRERAETLGLQIANFEPLEVIDNDEHEELFNSIFDEHPDAQAAYDHRKNSIGSKYQPDLIMLTHEEIHYFTAAENVSNARHVEERMKSGFQATYIYGDIEKPENIKDSFRYFNEGVTDKLAFDLYKDISFQDIGKIYEKVFPEKSKVQRLRHSENLDRTLNAAEEWRKNLLAETDNIRDVQERESKEQSINDSAEGSITRAKAFWKKQSEVYVSQDSIRNLHKEEDSPYKPFIDFVTNMVEGMALSKNISEQSSWDDLQRAYFKGNVLYLREFDKIYGEGFLRKLGTLDPDTADKDSGEWKEWEEIERIVRTKNEELRKKS